jgi:cellulose synthase/poly-beta-1,6-N-acetylglucosamine synthase-like glycosyltransferase
VNWDFRHLRVERLPPALLESTAVRPVAMSEAEIQLRLGASVSGLAERVPGVSARSLVSRGQRNFLIGLLIAFIVGLVLDAHLTVIVVIAWSTLSYLVAVIYRALLFMRSSKADALESVSDEEALSLPDSELPFYTVMVPAYREASVILKLVDNLSRLDYPVNRLEVILLVEEDDEETLDALRTIDAPSQFRLVVVPPAEPRTKPKALNFGLTLARGDIVAVYDVEDTPDVLQLRRAAAVLGRYGPEVGCLQAQLSYGNATQNIITKWFAIEYVMWFSAFLPGLSSMGAPIPLGGTSNHFRRDALRSLGGWDPYNVTEDCDLGIRMFREHYQIKVLRSVTLEEANSDFVNWVKQRSRWYKGYLQTFLIHLREPLGLTRQIGVKGVVHMTAFVGGTPVLAVLNPLFWVMTIVWFVAHPEFVKEIFPAPVYYIGLLLWVFGNFLLWYLTVLTARSTKRDGLVLAAVLIPVYWVMMSVAALKAMWQLLLTPSFWEKTTHGLQTEAETEPDDDAEGSDDETPRRLRLVS